MKRRGATTITCPSRTMSWIADLWPQCPRYQIMQAARRSTVAAFSVSEFRSLLSDQNVALAPQVKAYLHWAIRSLDRDAIASPLDF